MHIEFLEGHRLTLSAVHDGKTWIEATGVRDTSWPAESTELDGTGFAWSIKYDLIDVGSGPCFFLFKVHLQRSTAIVPDTLSIGFGPEVAPPYVWPALICPTVVENLLSGLDELKSAGIKFVDGSLRLKPGRWPALVGTFEARISLRTYLSL